MYITELCECKFSSTWFEIQVNLSVLRWWLTSVWLPKNTRKMENYLLQWSLCASFTSFMLLTVCFMRLVLQKWLNSKVTWCSQWSHAGGPFWYFWWRKKNSSCLSFVPILRGMEQWQKLMMMMGHDPERSLPHRPRSRRIYFSWTGET